MTSPQSTSKPILSSENDCEVLMDFFFFFFHLTEKVFYFCNYEKKKHKDCKDYHWPDIEDEITQLRSQQISVLTRVLKIENFGEF